MSNVCREKPADPNNIDMWSTGLGEIWVYRQTRTLATGAIGAIARTEDNIAAPGLVDIEVVQFQDGSSDRPVINLFIALGCIGWLSLARVIRGQVISLKTREFVEAARAVGVRRMLIVFRHLIPNTIGPVIVYSTLLVPGFILQEAFLSFLGLGVQPPDPSWGNMITEGATKLEHQTWLIYWPGTALALTLFAMNFLGDGIRDALDPQMQKE